ncbi:Ig-like domain-containing protein [Nocardioides halotolerans]|uniref:Ig-like domain-containing protein n=1 Tax=Nocardioides halotolerans TaxID=433660 RepID=UPI0012FA76E5|nr:Ig-like domain-containing protein [Nocardioides halotolerans]
MTRQSWRVLGPAAALCLTLVVPAASATPAAPRGGAAPVTAPDTVQTFPGNLAALRPLRNDTDAEGDRLRICARGPEHYPGIRVDVFEDQKDFYLTARRGTAPGTYTFTYFACDGTSATPGTVTLTVQKLPRITVRKIAGHPGRLRVTNGAPFRIRLVYGDYSQDDAEGDVRIPKKSSRVVSTRYSKISWFAFVMTPRGSGDEVGRGHVQGIRQP